MSAAPEKGPDGGTGDGSLGAGNESAVGIHGKQGNEAGGARDAQSPDRAGSEPLPRDHEHKGSYGGEGGKPRTSSDTREPTDPNPSPS